MTQAADDAPVYAFKPRMLCAEQVFRLGPDSLEWLAAGSNSRVAYPMIARVRVGYRFTNFMGYRYTTEIFPRGGGRMQIASTSARGILDNMSQGAAYRVFIAELHRRIVKARGECRFEAGMAAWRFWPSVVVTGAMGIALAYVLVLGLLGEQSVTGLVLVAFGVLFLWQMGKMVLGNRPRSYSPDAIPEETLPKK